MFGGAGCRLFEGENGLTGGGEVEIALALRRRFTENMDRMSYPRGDYDLSLAGRKPTGQTRPSAWKNSE